MKKLIYIACLIALLVVSLCACSFTVDSSSDTTNEVHSIGVKNANYGLDISNDTTRFIIPKSSSAGVFPGNNVRVDVIIGSNVFNNAVSAKCYYKITSSSMDSTTYLIFYAFKFIKSYYNVTNLISEGNFNRYYIGNDNLYKEIYSDNSPGSTFVLAVNQNLIIMQRSYTIEGIMTSPFVPSDRLKVLVEDSFDIKFRMKDEIGNYFILTKNYKYGAIIVVDFDIPKLDFSVFTGWNTPIVQVYRGAIYVAEYSTKKFTIVLYDYSNKELSRVQRTAYSTLALVYEPPDVSGLAFVGWSTEYFNKDKIINTSSHKVMSDLSLYATYSGGSVMPGPGQSNPLYKECEWWDFGQHLINFVGWLLFDMPIIKDVVSLIYSLIAFLVSLFGFLGVFAPMGFVGTLIIGIFGLFFLFKAIF